MATGFTQRWNGKVNAKQFWLNGTQVTASGADLNTLLGGGTVIAYTTAGTQTVAGAAGSATISASSGASVFTLGAAPVAGVEKTISLISVSSSVFLKAAAGSSFDPSTNTVIKSTYAQSITLIGLSSTKWGIQAVFPGSTVGISPASGITLSTTT